MRKSDGGQDKIIFLGNYIGHNKNGHKVIDRLIALKKKYGNHIICLCGNHEIMLLESLGYIYCDNPSYVFDMWKQDGASQTVIGYMERAGMSDNPIGFTPGRIKDLIPKEHIDFMMSLDGCYEEDNFVFVHGGYNPSESFEKCDIKALACDRYLFGFVMMLINTGEPMPWKNTIIVGHSNNSVGIPLIRDKFMMLDCGPQKLLVVEARSRKAFMSFPNKNRLVEFKLKETVMVKSSRKSGRCVH